MRARVTALGAAAVVLLTTASSCDPVDCNQLLDKPPTAEQQAASEQVVMGEAVEVEVEVTDPKTDTDVECVVQGDRWVNVTDDAP